MDIEFRFIEFNPRRAMRGAGAARVEVTEGEKSGWLWMSERDIARNITTFGSHPELVKAQEAYRNGR